MGEGLKILFFRRNTGEPQGGAIAKKDLGKVAGNDGLVACSDDGLRGVLAGAATTKVHAGDENRRPLELGLIDGVVLGLTFWSLADVTEEKFPQTVEGDATHVASGDNAVSIDIVPLHRNGTTGNFLNRGERHIRFGQKLFWRR